MTITENKNGDSLDFIVVGRLDTTTAPLFESRLKGLPKGLKILNVNLKDVEYISSAGLRVVLLAHKMMAGLGSKMIIKHPSEFCVQVLEATGMDSVLSIEKD